MRLLKVHLPNIRTKIVSVLEKSGNRTEFKLDINNDLMNVAHQITSKPLKFVSAILAKPGVKNQEFHSDSDEGERAIVYLSKVENDTGALEFKSGKVFGSKGTCIHYNAKEIHRGCSTTKSRFVLAFAFSDQNTPILSIGQSTESDITMISSTRGYFTLSNDSALGSSQAIVLLPLENYFVNNYLNGFPLEPIPIGGKKLFDGAKLTNSDQVIINYDTSIDVVDVFGVQVRSFNNLILGGGRGLAPTPDSFFIDGRIDITFAQPTNGFILAKTFIGDSNTTSYSTSTIVDASSVSNSNSNLEIGLFFLTSILVFFIILYFFKPKFASLKI